MKKKNDDSLDGKAENSSENPLKSPPTQLRKCLQSQIQKMNIDLSPSIK